MLLKNSFTILFLFFLWSIQGVAQTQDSVIVTQETTVKTNNDTDGDNDDEYETRSRVGIRAGVVISKQQFDQGDLDVNPDSKFGLDLALIAEFPLGENFALSPEFHWMQKGSKIEDINGSFPESTSTLNYLEIPVLAKFTFGDEAAFNVFFGPSLGYLFSGTDKDGDGNTNDIDLDDFNRTELGAHLGAGIRLGPVVLDVRYILGFSNIANIDEDDDLEIHNRSYGAGLSIMF